MENVVKLKGTLRSNPKLMYTPKGTAICVLAVEIKRPIKDRTGDHSFITKSYRIIARNRFAEICSNILKKDHFVDLEGNVFSYTYIDKYGNKRIISEIVSDSIKYGLNDFSLESIKAA